MQRAQTVVKGSVFQRVPIRHTLDNTLTLYQQIALTLQNMLGLRLKAIQVNKVQQEQQEQLVRLEQLEPQVRLVLLVQQELLVSKVNKVFKVNKVQLVLLVRQEQLGQQEQLV